jgi:glycosyltransferase involved in cell wall biosynthesis
VQNSQNPLVSIIIPTRNSSSTLEQCLASVSEQSYQNIEIIVVDNHSTDSTIAIARKYTDKVLTIGPERSAQVNYGVENASGKYVYRVDSDFVLDKNIVQEALTTAEANGYDAILIHNSSDPTVSFWAKVRKFERDMYETDDTNVAVRFIKREVFLKVGGFDTALVAAEDYDLHNRIAKQFRIGKIKYKEVHLGEPRSLKEIAEKHYYYGKTISAFLEKNKGRGIKQVTPIRSAYLRHYKQFLKHPMLSAGFIIYQVVRYATSAMGLIAYRILK